MKVPRLRQVPSARDLSPFLDRWRPRPLMRPEHATSRSCSSPAKLEENEKSAHCRCLRVLERGRMASECPLPDRFATWAKARAMQHWIDRTGIGSTGPAPFGTGPVGVRRSTGDRGWPDCCPNDWVCRRRPGRGRTCWGCHRGALCDHGAGAAVAGRPDRLGQSS